MVGPIYQTQNATSTLVTSAGTALAANNARIAFSIQNLSGSNPLYVYFGASASTSVFSYILAPGASQDDGKGTTLSMENGVVYDGLITIAGTSPRCICVEIAP